MSRLAWAWPAVFILLLAACTAPRAPTKVPDIRVAAIDPESIGINQQVFLLRLSLVNPNDVPLRVAAARLRLDLEDLSAGTGELVDGFSLPAGEQGTATVRIETDLVSQAPQFLSWLMSGDATLDYRVTGYVDMIGLGLGRVPVDDRGIVPLRPGPRSSKRDDTVAL
ncbi:MAG: LEA type 2 family protein [Chromatiales bacterium]|nr:MAG: LEA type 2 family protein [Chromatiales bacterium]